MPETAKYPGALEPGNAYVSEERDEDYNDYLDFLDDKYIDDDYLMPQDWHFTEGERILAPNSQTGTVTCMQRAAVEISTVDGAFWYRWHDVIKIFQLGDYVEVVGGEFCGRHGFVQDVGDAIFIDVMEGQYSKSVREMLIHRNSATIISLPTTSNNFAVSPEEIARRMYTGRVPWQGLRILVLSATAESRKRHFNLLDTTSRPGTGGQSHSADIHKGKVGKVLDVGVNQTTASRLRVCIRLEQSYSAVHNYRDIWVDYNEVVEETTGLPLRFYQLLHQSQLAFLPSREYRRMRKEHENIARGQLLAAQVALRLQRTSPSPPRSTTPPHEGTSEDLGTGNAWDVTAPDPPDPAMYHWSRHPALNQRELQVNIQGKSQPQKVRLEPSGAKSIMKVIFRTTLTEVRDLTRVTPLQPTVCDFHRWVVIQGPHIGKYVRGICYVQGSNPILWTVREITCAEHGHDLLVGEPFNVHNTDLCQAADSQATLDINNQWAQSIREAPMKLKKRKL
ncbi:uncharacterized protein EV420DRAFT_1764465 [Desarmillaria tabescens]|uniref:Uncharacterized protein n=1 Tax=Armillaria tabescens TaxID=1929756 RepID=A0AA39N5F7_ARMTA|nr:uncharacterized protein EV420DRAFT_1764465 [Desarmillaria tabescens]KAK0457940.1 hypothetical protein EV420DRAFT_1764465 [Desarmillaria tabescens]